MKRFERILCPTDFSKYSFRAADYAVALARYYDSEIHFLHAVPGPVVVAEPHYPYAAAPIAAEDRETARDRLDAFVSLCRAENVRTRFDVEDGNAVSAILETAASDEADLICLGTHGREGFERLVLGSVAEKVIRKAHSPVLTVSEAGEEDAVRPALFGNILCAVDFAPQSLHAVSYALSLAQEAEGRLLLVNALEYFVTEPSFGDEAALADYRERMEQSVRERLDELVPDDARAWCQPEALVLSGKPYRIILELAEERDVDLIVMGVRGKNPLDRALFGSNTEHVVRRAPCPVLTIRG